MTTSEISAIGSRHNLEGVRQIVDEPVSSLGCDSPKVLDNVPGTAQSRKRTFQSC